MDFSIKKKVMKDTFARVEEMTAHVKEYVNNRMASVKLSAAEKSSKLVANVIALAVVVIVFTLFIVFASIALAFAFARLTGEFYWGFLIVAGIYLLLGISVWLMKEKIIQLPIMNSILQQLFKEDEED
jgi:energy-coupling factor transporter transmembrane protein EcfT